MLVGLRGGDFLELHPGHDNAFAADRAETFNHIAHGPLPVFMSPVGGEEGLQSLIGVPLEVIGQGAEEHVAADAIIGFVRCRARLQLRGLEVAECPFDEFEAFSK